MLQGYPAVIIRGFEDATACLGPGLPVTLVSERGAALFAGCGWWRAVVTRARETYPATPMKDVLDCGDGSGQALAALRLGQRLIVLDCDAPGRESVKAAAWALGGEVLSRPPPALDPRSGGWRRLEGWLRGGDR